MTNIFKTVDNRIQLTQLWESFATKEVIALDDLNLTMQTRVRGTDDDVVDEYSAALEAGAVFPPIDVFCVNEEGGQELYLVDGFHRSAAYKDLLFVTTEARVFHGLSKDEARLYAHFANLKNGKSASTEDIIAAIGALINMESAKEIAFKSKYELDCAAIAKWVGCTQRHVRTHTTELRDHLQTMRDAEIEVRTLGGESQRKVGSEVGVDHKSVSNTIKKLGEKRNSSEIPHPVTSSQLFDSAKYEEDEAPFDTEDGTATSESPVSETKSTPIYTPGKPLTKAEMDAALEKVEEMNQRGFATIARHMNKTSKAPKKTKADLASDVITAFGAFASKCPDVETGKYDLNQLIKVATCTAGVREDIKVVQNFLNLLNEALNTQNSPSNLLPTEETVFSY